MSTQHTRGPWHYQEGADKYTHIVRTGEVSRDNPHVGRRFLCQLAQDTSGEAEANARLIAAAPDMLAVLKELIAAYQADAVEMNSAEIQADGQPPHPWHEEWLHHVRAAIAKAEGRP